MNNKYFQGNPNKQREISFLVREYFNFSELETLDKTIQFYGESLIGNLRKNLDEEKQNINSGFSLPSGLDWWNKSAVEEYYKDLEKSFPGVVKKNLDNLQRVNLKFQILSVIDFSNNWEKFLKRILIIFGEKVPENASYANFVLEKINNKFPDFKNTELSKYVKLVRKVSNRIKHDLRTDTNQDFYNETLEYLLQAQKLVFNSMNSYYINQEWKEFYLNSSDSEKEEIDRDNFEQKKYLDSIRDNMNVNNMNISYLIKWSISLINKWIHENFSFDTAKMININCPIDKFGLEKNIMFEVFGDGEKRHLLKNKEEFCNKNTFHLYEMRNKQ